MPTSKFEAKLIELAGPRCPEVVEGCAVCGAWQLYDRQDWGKLLALLIDVEEATKDGDITKIIEQLRKECHG